MRTKLVDKTDISRKVCTIEPKANAMLVEFWEQLGK
jgi:hypothetical protein